MFYNLETIYYEEPTLSEVQKAVWQLGNNQAPEKYEIVAELIKYGETDWKEPWMK